MKNWKTTGLGVLAFLAFGYKVYQTRELNIDEAWLLITGLIGIAAKDHNVTGGSVEQ